MSICPHVRVRMGSKSVILRFFNSGYAHDRNISIFRRRAFLRTRNTLVKPNYASVRQSRDSLHSDRHKVTQKKSRLRRALKPLELKISKKCTETCFVAHYYACKFGVNRLRNDGDIRQKTAIIDNCDFVVIAIYRLRPIQQHCYHRY